MEGETFLNWDIRAIQVEDLGFFDYVKDSLAERRQANFLGYDDGTLNDDDWMDLANQMHHERS